MMRECSRLYHKKGGIMDYSYLEVSQMLEKHPLLKEKQSYRNIYLSLLKYYTKKYSENDLWANATINLYINKLTEYREDQSDKENINRTVRRVMSTRFKPFRLYTYRYCFMYDCMFINALKDANKAKRIYEDITEYLTNNCKAKMSPVFDSLYSSYCETGDSRIDEYIKTCWSENRAFAKTELTRIAITANMSAGKSTLINAIVGKKVNRTQQESCTAKIHYIVNKPYEDGLNYEYDHLLDLDADMQTLMDDNPNNTSDEIVVGTHFFTVGTDSQRVWLVDTPGVNSSKDIALKHMTENYLKNNTADLLIYLINGEQAGTDDDKKHLMFVQRNYHGRVLFVINKIDRYKKKEDSIKKTIENAISELKEIGFVAPEIVPVSSYAAFLAKQVIEGIDIDEDEADEFNGMLRRLKRPEYRLEQYYPEWIQEKLHNINRTSEAMDLLFQSGILHLEQMLYSIKKHND